MKDCYNEAKAASTVAGMKGYCSEALLAASSVAGMKGCCSEAPLAASTVAAGMKVRSALSQWAAQSVATWDYRMPGCYISVPVACLVETAATRLKVSSDCVPPEAS